MLSQQSKKDIKRKLNFIYKSTKSKKELKIYADEIFQIINKYNKNGKKLKKQSLSLCFVLEVLDVKKPQFF